MENALTTTNLSKSYGSQRVLRDCSIHVPERSIYGLVGRNGAGKTTLFRILCGLQEPTTGIYTLYGAHSGTPAVLKARRRLGAIVESPAVIGNLSAADNLRAEARLLGISGDNLISSTLRLVGLSGTGSKKAKNFSLGMRQRLGIACALLGTPDFLILDEPANGLDPQGIIEMRELVTRLNAEHGITFLISSHILDELSRMATWYGFLNGGRLVQEISAETLRARCSRSVVLDVDDAAKAAPVLDALQLSYQTESKTRLLISGQPAVSPLVLALNERGVEVRNLSDVEETLESYFVRLLGGEQ